MANDLQILIELQSIDNRIHELEKSKEEYPRQVEELEARISEPKKEIDSIEKKLAENEEERKKNQSKVADSKAALEKSEERLNAITTNREYDAVHSEIAAQKTGLSQAETKLKALLSEDEHLTEALESARKTYEEAKTENQPQIDDLKQKIASIDSDIAKVQKERNKITPKLIPANLRAYEHIHSRRKSGVAVSIVTEAGNCSVCYKMLEAQRVNEVRKGIRLQICESCGSILIWNSGEEASEG